MEKSLTGPPLARLFDPRSVAIVGASADPAKLGHVVLHNLRATGYSGEIYLVNPGADEIAGLRCYPSARELPLAPDVAIVVVPPDTVAGAVSDCAERGVGYAIVGTNGFVEAGTDQGRRRQDELAKLVGASPMRIVGPNCNGIRSVTDGVSIGFNRSHREPIPAGSLTVLSHSGAQFNATARRATQLRIGLSKYVSLGNEIDVDLLELLEHLVDDDATGVVGLIVDAIEDHERFRDACHRLRERGKPVLLLRFGESELGALAAEAHSGRPISAGIPEDAELDALGVGRVGTIEALVSAAAILQRRPPGWRSGVGVATLSGAGGAMFADAAAREGIPLARLGDWAKAALSELSEQVMVPNPVDIGVLRSPSTGLGEVLRILRGEPAVSDIVLFGQEMVSDESWEWFMPTLAQAAARDGAPLILLAAGGFPPEYDSAVRDLGIVFLTETRTCVEALRAVYETGR
jgi:acyl-CoA synthetase (NDP forming)